MRTVLPPSAISSMRPSTARADSGSRPAVGSSSSRRSGSWSTARAERETGPHAGRVAADPLVERVGDARSARGLGDARVDQVAAPPGTARPRSARLSVPDRRS